LEDDVRGDGSTLDAMNGYVAEVGIRGALDLEGAAAWHWDVSLYYARIRDEILSVEDPSAPGTSLSANIGRTIHAGVEALVGGRLSALACARDAARGDNGLPVAPDYAIGGEVMCRHASGFFGGPTFDLVGSRYADFSNTYRVASYSLLGLRAGIGREDWEL